MGLLEQARHAACCVPRTGGLPARNRFVFVDEPKMRHENNMKVALRIDANTEMSKKFVKFVNSDEFDNLCAAAAINQKENAREHCLLESVPCCCIRTDNKVVFLERAACKSKLFTLARCLTLVPCSSRSRQRP